MATLRPTTDPSQWKTWWQSWENHPTMAVEYDLVLTYWWSAGTSLLKCSLKIHVPELWRCFSHEIWEKNTWSIALSKQKSLEVEWFGLLWTYWTHFRSFHLDSLANDMSHHASYTPWKMSMSAWKITIFNRRYIFKWLFSIFMLGFGGKNHLKKKHYDAIDGTQKVPQSYFKWGCIML